MFAVTGITGKVGGAVARALLGAGVPVRAVVRSAAKGGPWAARGCDVAAADLDNPAPLAAALTGVDGAFAMLPPIFDPAPGFPEAKRMIGTLRAAIAEALPPKLVVLSTVGADATRPNLLNQLGLLERALADLPIPVTFLRPGWFMENAAADIASARESGVVSSYLQPLDHAVPMIAAEDVGRTAAELLQENWVGHRIVELQAAERVTPNAIASAFAEALGRSVRAEVVPRPSWERIFRSQGMRNPFPRMQMVDGFNEGWIDFPNCGAGARKGRIDVDSAIATLVRKEMDR
jgi:NAD(P)H dehydrogenase (quinone)